MGKTVTDENIRVRAYYIWQETGKDADYCWIRACEEMLTPVQGCAKKTASCKTTSCKASTKKTPAKSTTSAKKADKPAAAEVPFYGVKKKK